MPDLLTYYESLTDEQKGLVIRNINSQAGIPYPTFRRNMLKKKFSIAQQIAISQVLGTPKEELFPEPTSHNI